MRKLLFIVFLQSCIYQKPDIIPICIAETNLPITFKASIQAIIQKNCLSCHSNKAHLGGVKIEDISDLKFYASSVLYDQIITFDGLPPRMPKGNSMTDCDVKTIKKWIDSGMN
jgi:uncharacterized membrane protein